MNNLQKAQAQLNQCGIDTTIENDCLCVYAGDVPLELSEFEVKFRAKLYDENLMLDEG